MEHESVTEFDYEEDQEDVAEHLHPGSRAAVVSGTDWTTETLVTQLKRGNIQLNPGFQRRDAWKRDRKSRFIESLIVGLPIPQIVLAESKKDRGKFLVLDGKQRLLAILQFWGHGEGENNAFALRGLTLREELKGKQLVDLSTDPEWESDYNSLCNRPIRTVVIQDWKSTDLLHTIFLRLNTGSVPLSPQELRQALQPGDYSSYVDEAAAESENLHRLLRVEGPDPRMRDTEILARFVAFRFFASSYPGRMKSFLDESFESLNEQWEKRQKAIRSAVEQFEEGAESLIELFGDSVARKPGSSQFNRAIFDVLIYFHSQDSVRSGTRGKKTPLRRAYDGLFEQGSEFLKAIESDTAGAPNTRARFQIWGETLSRIAEVSIAIPKIPTKAPRKQAKGPTKNRRTR